VTEKASLLQSWGRLPGWGRGGGEPQPPTASPKVPGGGRGGGGGTVRRRGKLMFKS